MPRLMTNLHGAEVIMTSAVEQRMRHQGDWWKFSKRVFRQLGPGNPMVICLDLSVNGLGDAIHAMPAIAAKIAEGYFVAVYANGFYRKIFESLGCEFHYEHEPIHEYAYGAIYRMKMWYSEHEADCGAGAIELTRFEQFAKIIGVQLPESFDFRKYLL